MMAQIAAGVNSNRQEVNMAWQLPEGMEEYLKPTELCDCENEELKRRAKEIIKDAETPKGAALKVFSFVRDGVPVKLDAIGDKASKTLKKGGGSCANKTNLQIALLRAVGVPARYHQVNIRKESLKGIVSGFMYKQLPGIVWWHPWCECYLSERWVACEALYDEALYRATLQEGLLTTEQIPSIDWDGENDLHVVDTWIVQDVGTFASLDEAFKKAQKERGVRALLFGWLVIFLSNRHTERLRKHSD